MKLLFGRPVKAHKASPDQLELFRQDTLDIESWLRRKAEEWESKDQRLAARFERGADEVERAANRLQERIQQNITEDEDKQ